MKTEYEATFTTINKDEIRHKLNSIGAKLIKPEFMQKRCTFELPSGHEIPNGWLRVRDEQDRITMSLKVVTENGTIDQQQEIELKVDKFQDACELLEKIGCEQKAYQESKREFWELANVQISIDEWPFLEPFVEIEGESEEQVRKIAQRLGFDYTKAYFGSVTGLYARRYGISEERINKNTPLILFNMEKNPFLPTPTK